MADEAPGASGDGTEPRPFEAVRKILTDELAQERSAEARKTFMTPIQEAVGFEVQVGLKIATGGRQTRIPRGLRPSRASAARGQ